MTYEIYFTQAFTLQQNLRIYSITHTTHYKLTNENYFSTVEYHDDFNFDVNNILTLTGKIFVQNLMKIRGIKEFNIIIEPNHDILSLNLYKLNITKYRHFTWSEIEDGLSVLFHRNVFSLYTHLSALKERDEYKKIYYFPDHNHLILYTQVKLLKRNIYSCLNIRYDSFHNIIIGPDNLSNILTRKTFKYIKQILEPAIESINIHRHHIHITFYNPVAVLVTIQSYYLNHFNNVFFKNRYNLDTINAAMLDCNNLHDISYE